MTYLMFIVCLLVFYGFLGLCLCVYPEDGVVWLVFCFVLGSFMLGVIGVSFVALMLFIVYVGGMMVVFAYSVAVTSEVGVKVGRWVRKVVSFCFGVVAFCFGFYVVGGLSFLFRVGLLFDGSVSSDFDGVSLFYSDGAFCLLICGWGLFLVLFVVLELVRGGFRGALRAV
uniref:NADH-ubiquinone oxidoreductase chain 6 n=1 Tax=Rena humilis TaxID=711330 RepID=Q6I7X6_RENHU|nr:NADH dehydrogenase subunit 6 [Rena humilis]BAD24748.1 NADH dehydrogenase subunit 6 [Rena humilis]